MADLWFALSMLTLGAAMVDSAKPSGHYTGVYSSTLLQHLDPPFKEEVCSDAKEQERAALLAKGSCGSPTRVPIRMLVPPYLSVSPDIVWLKRCIGHCNVGIVCTALTGTNVEIPVRMYNVKNNKESCAMYPSIEHETCECRYEDFITKIHITNA